MGMLRITASGAYYSGAGKRGKDIVDFENVVGLIPVIDRERVQQAVMWRMIQIWISKDKRYYGEENIKRFDLLRVCYIDKIEEVDGKPAIIGKNVKDLDWEGLQDLAVWKNLRKIPNYKTTDLRTARETAYLEYSRLLGRKIDPDRKGYDYGALPELIIEDDDRVAAPPVTKSNEEVIAEEQENRSAEEEKTFTLVELRKIAKAKGIKLPSKATLDEAYRIVIKGEKDE